MRIKDINTNSSAVCNGCYQIASGEVYVKGLCCDGCVIMERTINDCL